MVTGGRCCYHRHLGIMDVYLADGHLGHPRVTCPHASPNAMIAPSIRLLIISQSCFAAGDLRDSSIKGLHKIPGILEIPPEPGPMLPVRLEVPANYSCCRHYRMSAAAPGSRAGGQILLFPFYNSTSEYEFYAERSL